MAKQQKERRVRITKVRWTLIRNGYTEEGTREEWLKIAARFGSEAEALKTYSLETIESTLVSPSDLTSEKETN